MIIYIIITKTNDNILAAYTSYELALHHVETNKDNKLECYIKKQEVSDKLPNWAIKHLEEKYL